MNIRVKLDSRIIALIVFFSSIALSIWYAVDSWDSYSSAADNVREVWTILAIGLTAGSVVSLIVKVLGKIAARE